jgi:hypothetical protein
MRLSSSTTATTSRRRAGDSDLVLLLVILLLALPLSVVLWPVISMTVGQPKSSEFVRTEHGTLALSCTELPVEFAEKWATDDWSPIRSRMKAALLSGEQDGVVKVCGVEGIGIRPAAPESIPSTSK